METRQVAIKRVAAIRRHLDSHPIVEQQLDNTKSPILFKSSGCLRTYILNRPDKLNAIQDTMLMLLLEQIEKWRASASPCVIVGTGNGRAFCAGGDLEMWCSLVSRPETVQAVVNNFCSQFSFDYYLARMPLLHIVIMDGLTMGAGAGLAANAPFRIATERTIFSMPEVKIGYCPDVGASYFLNRFDGEIGTYLALTSENLRGRAVYEHGFATHFIASSDLPDVLHHISLLNNPTVQQIDSLLRKHDPESVFHGLSSHLVGPIRAALDSAFRHDSVEYITQELAGYANNHDDDDVRRWAQSTLRTLSTRSPTSLKVTLALIRRSKGMSLLDALQSELNMVTAFCNGSGPDLFTGLQAVLTGRMPDETPWYPDALEKVSDSYIQEEFFHKYSPERGTAPRIRLYNLPHNVEPADAMRFSLPSEEEIRRMVEENNHGSLLSLEELAAKIKSSTRDKAGVEEKIFDVVSRKCTQLDDSQGRMRLMWTR
ncbi:3-hydroxyisobutyryl-CoA hydrolase [Wolfiporia cocos MD-104 SS10]|uniref:3-hydroxyisobutyryl-CoA hydrolase n=1 Tax=Wolfiporia cocos (strain MD-104) TaxID=742152 RepID=A0A2H3J5Y0_WOLCO|nr:3-hydroxyisobutyryl-CoA hydrolase [Wolfiporia cocos MD-104 SS10]